MTPPPFLVHGVPCRVYLLARDTWAWHAGHLCGSATTEAAAVEAAKREATAIGLEAARRAAR